MSKTAKLRVTQPETTDAWADTWAPCPKCPTETAHRVLARATVSDSEAIGGGYEVSWSTSYDLIRCQGCTTVSFREESYFSEDEGSSTTYYPGGRVGQLEELHLLPDAVRQVYLEARSALRSKLKILAAVGVRAVVEAVCADKRAAPRLTNGRPTSLYALIEGLATKGLTPPGGAAALHGLRALGNSGAHNARVHTQEQLDIALATLEHLLRTVYVIPSNAKQLPRERRRRSSKKKKR